MAQQLTNHEEAEQSLALLSGLRIWHWHDWQGGPQTRLKPTIVMAVVKGGLARKPPYTLVGPKKKKKKKKKKDTGKPFDTSSDKGKETSREERLKIKAGLPYRARTLTRS